MKSETQYQTAVTGSESGATKWWVLFLLTLVYTVNIADRYVVSTLIEPIKHEFKLSDSEVGFMTGTAIALFYVTLSLPLGLLADRVNRKRMISVALAVWSGFTVMCGASSSALTFFLSRLGVGIGEAGCMPCAVSLLADKFAPSKRGTAMSLFSVGAAVGALMGSAGGGWIADHHGWRAVLLVFGCLGVPLAIILMLGFREPRRGVFDKPESEVNRAGLKETLRHIRDCKALFHVITGTTVLTFWGWGLVWWTPSFLARSFHLSVGDAGEILGVIHGAGGGLAMLCTALVLSRPRAGSGCSQAKLVALVTALATVPSFVAYASPSLSLTHIMLWVFIPTIYVYIGPSASLAQNLTPAAMRGQVVGIIVFVTNVANLVIAPQAVGFLSDTLATHVANPAESLRYVLVLVSLTGLWAAWHFYLAARYMRAEESERTSAQMPGVSVHGS
ncbi:putative MFS family arabinose efflux permease [Paraburkholderia sp. BL27I4N3]|uniref:spinster family MFS transporter n=1 Tax=Paraburkholderia sp. BL27I4N3 TaxID=1938805 RepID=UPI000E24C018|nr:MFS transporter [Paraburkholderia sp. BL27I4N3]REE07555.1 putative MFS family arabinose efflux permease [Paraburkholderia sp. BL27I4N3]